MTKVTGRQRAAAYLISIPLAVGWTALCAFITGWHHNPSLLQLLLNAIGVVVIVWETCSILFERLPERRAKRDE